MNVWFWYSALLALGLGSGFASGVAPSDQALTITMAFTIVALFASLLVPFAGFSADEVWQKLALQYCPVPLIGVCAYVTFERPSPAAFVVMVSMAAIHFGYWTSSIQSRLYRWENWKAGFAPTYPKTTMLLAALNIAGRAEVANEIICAIAAGRKPSFERVPKELRPFVEASEAEQTHTTNEGEGTP